ncbi:family 43 glycosylhydrolase [Saccharopolyspora sp. CA-218241]|uniref:family 43 glycosylhydrolase n=1 Tax=Saccharopolyspora sp. CA-218241 TaxID=3240027 RepID=UPI003D965475
MTVQRLTRLLATVLIVPLLSTTAEGLPAPVEPAPATTYTNPVTAGVVDTFPDPTMIRGGDGDWYAYGTTNPVFHSRGESGERILPVLRSTDMVGWTYAGDVFTAGDRPSWWPPGTRPFAPDIRYVAGSYHLTYGLSGGGVALATAPSPTGPWTDRGLIVTLADGCPTNPRGTIDQAMLTGADGVHYLYWGSYDAMCVAAMNAEATRLEGPVTIVARGRRAEAAFPVRRGDFYYLFYSDGGCCQGAFSGYTVKVGRSDDPRGPFVTQDGQSLTDYSSKGGIVAAANGGGFVGPGHNSIQTDLAGQDWLVYHAIPAADPDFPPVETADGVKPALSKRPMLVDRLDWIDGWPVLRGGAGPSSRPQRAPVTEATVGSTFNGSALPRGWKADGDPAARWTSAEAPASGGVLAQTGSPAEPSVFLAPRRIGGDIRTEARLKLADAGTGGAVGLVVSDRGPRGTIAARLDRADHALSVSVTRDGVTTTSSAALPATFDHRSWHVLAVEVRGSSLTAEVSEDRSRDVQAAVSVPLPDRELRPGRVGVLSTGAPAVADNLSAVPLHRPATTRVDDPQPGAPLPAHSDDFSGNGRPEDLDPAWSWVRGDEATATAAGGKLTWPTGGTELFLGTNTAPVLLRDAPAGDFIVETKLSFDGTRPAQQAGLVLYDGDDRYFKLTHSVLPVTAGDGAVFRQTEFAKEGERPTTTPPTPVFYGPMFGGPPATQTWLRLAYHANPATGAHDVRAASSTDGVHWTWAGTWSMPRRGPLKIGLVSLNAPGATAEFDYVRTFRTSTGG